MTWWWKKRRFDEDPAWDLWIGIVALPILAGAILGAAAIAPDPHAFELGWWVILILLALLLGSLSFFWVAPCLAELHRRGLWTPLGTGHVRLEAAALTVLFGVLALGLMLGAAWFAGFLGKPSIPLTSAVLTMAQAERGAQTLSGFDCGGRAHNAPPNSQVERTRWRAPLA